MSEKREADEERVSILTPVLNLFVPIPAQSSVQLGVNQPQARLKAAQGLFPTRAPLAAKDWMQLCIF